MSLLVFCPVFNWECNIEVSKYYCIIYFLLQLSRFFLNIFWGHCFYIHMYNYCSLPLNWTLYHYKTSLVSSGLLFFFFYLKVYFSWYYYNHSSSFCYCLHGVFHPCSLTYLCFWIKSVSLKLDAIFKSSVSLKLDPVFNLI